MHEELVTECQLGDISLFKRKVEEKYPSPLALLITFLCIGGIIAYGAVLLVQYVATGNTPTVTVTQGVLDSDYVFTTGFMCQCQYGCMLTAVGVCTVQMNPKFTNAHYTVAYQDGLEISVCNGFTEAIVIAADSTGTIVGKPVFSDTVTRMFSGACVAPGNYNITSTNPAAFATQAARLIGAFKDVKGLNVELDDFPGYSGYGGATVRRISVQNETDVSGVSVISGVYSSDSAITRSQCNPNYAPGDLVYCQGISLAAVYQNIVKTRSANILNFLGSWGGAASTIYSFFSLAIAFFFVTFKTCQRCRDRRNKVKSEDYAPKDDKDGKKKGSAKMDTTSDHTSGSSDA